MLREQVSKWLLEERHFTFLLSVCVDMRMTIGIFRSLDPLSIVTIAPWCSFWSHFGTGCRDGLVCVCVCVFACVYSCLTQGHRICVQFLIAHNIYICRSHRNSHHLTTVFGIKSKSVAKVEEGAKNYEKYLNINASRSLLHRTTGYWQNRWFHLQKSIVVALLLKENTPQKPAFSFSLTLATCAWALLTRVALTQKVLLWIN